MFFGILKVTTSQAVIIIDLLVYLTTWLEPIKFLVYLSQWCEKLLQIYLKFI